MLSVVHAANCRQLSSGISLAADRTESISWEVSLFHGGLPPPMSSSSPCCSFRLSHR